MLAVKEPVEPLKTERAEFSQKTKAEAFLRAGGRCAACGQSITGTVEYDHETPCALGGDITPEPGPDDWKAVYVALDDLLQLMEAKFTECLNDQDMRPQQRCAAIVRKNTVFCNVRLLFQTMHEIDPHNPESPFHT
ncbi:hypothetical protein SAMN04515647_2211 [Cohaesibacter sp. ES.047]|uniref:hypothetical protein n=1 Tax=Cohaesibacter sp. ES.047 TaxID=1798205 RepID=UPI000BB73D3A|nr:hypothetical protein [Cohaesibacter sp. ES.047]SNY91967.1 hypothetical protein SAMN04515647_2211 [Cohaesibacter sp. ES.047]